MKSGILLALFFFSLAAIADGNTCPPDMASIARDADASFCIDRYEAPNQKGAYPLAAKGADEGQQWCGLQGKRLCTQNEWERACSGPSGRKYPYGEKYRRGKCVDEKTYRIVHWRLFQNALTDSGRKHLEELYQAEPSGSRPECVSEEEVYDLAGNVSEWVTLAKPTKSGLWHGMMGCYWSGCYNMHKAMGTKPGCFNTRNAGHSGVANEFRTYESGFRCCLSPNLKPR